MIATGADLQFAPVGVLNTKCSSSDEVVRHNIIENMKRRIPRLHQLSEYGKYRNDPLAIVAGGPSLNKTVEELRTIDRQMVCGSAHDHVVSMGFDPEFSVLCDAHPSELDFIKLSDHRRTYFVASMCDPSVFDALSDHRVVMWHNFQGDLEIFGEETKFAIKGGCTVTTRALCIAIMLGFHDLHFFGFDSSFEDSEYAYGGNPSSGTHIKARAGSRVFDTTTGWLAQATHFREMCLTMGFIFKPTVHGDGLIAAMLNTKEN